MDIPAATLAQVRTGRDGRRVLIEDDVLDIARQLQAIDARLALQWNDGGFFAVIEMDGDTERLVTTTTELDQRLVERMREIASPDHDYVKELDTLDKAAERESDRRFSEQAGEIGERLAYHVRKDIGATHRIVVPKGV